MDMIAAVLVFLGGLFAATFSKLAADEIKAWLPSLTEHLLRRAATKLPSDQRERYQNEWRAELWDTPGDISKLILAIKLQREADDVLLVLSKSQRHLWYSRALDVAFASFSLVLFAPLFLSLAVAVKLDSPGPVFIREHRVGPDGRRFSLTKFRLGRRYPEQRLTIVAVVLKTTSLDELPSLVNILKGDYPTGAKVLLRKVWLLHKRVWRRIFNGPR